MGPRGWIVTGWLLIAVAVGFAVAALTLVLSGGQPAACIPLAGGTCRAAGFQSAPSPLAYPAVGGGILTGLVCAVGAGVAFFSALACIFWAAHLRTLDALRALAGARKP